MPYQWLTFSQARQQLASRLAVSGYPSQFWVDAECGIYIIEALRMFNSLTGTWKQDFTFNNTNSLWNSLATLPNSPRLRTVRDTDVYTQMQYHLLEPPTGGVWTGTSQFEMSDLSGALQRRRDEIIQVTNCNCTLMPNIPSIPNKRRTLVADTVIDIQRVRFVPDFPSTGPKIPPVTLFRDDELGMEFFEPEFRQEAAAMPEQYSVSAEPQLSFDVDIPPSIPGTYEAVVSQSGTPFNTPDSTLLGIPDDFAWVAKWGAMADILGRESEATDRLRAGWCMRRYQDGLNLMLKSPWIMLGNVDEESVDLPAMSTLDRFDPEWDRDTENFGPCIVLAGMDFIAAPTGKGIGVTVLGNAPIPVNDGDFVQVSRSNWDAVLDMAQFLAAFKQYGQEFTDALELERSFVQACSAENSRLKSLGLFSDILNQRAQAQDRRQERYSTASQQQQPLQGQ